MFAQISFYWEAVLEREPWFIYFCRINLQSRFVTFKQTLKHYDRIILFLKRELFLLLNDDRLGSSILCNHKFPSISPCGRGQKVLVQKRRNLELFWFYRFKQSQPIGGLVRSGLNQQPKTQSNKLGSNSSWRQWDISHAHWDQMPHVLILRRPQDCCSPLPVTVTVASFFGWLVRSWNTAEGTENMNGGLMGPGPRMWLRSCEFESLLGKKKTSLGKWRAPTLWILWRMLKLA